MRRLLLAAFLTFTAAPMSFAANSWEVFKINLRIPFGSSYYDFVLPKPQNISPFEVFYVPTMSCRGFSLNVAVWYPGGSAWDPVTYKDSVLITKDREVYAVKLQIQSQYASQSCEISVVTLRDPSKPKPQPEPEPEPQPEPEPEPQPEPEPELPGEWREAGVLNFPGGALKQGNLQLNSAYYARDIAIKVPAECQDIRVEEAGILRQDMYTKAKPLANRPGIFRLDEISSFRQARVILSGPEGQSCPIAIYVYDHT